MLEVDFKCLFREQVNRDRSTCKGVDCQDIKTLLLVAHPLVLQCDAGVAQDDLGPALAPREEAEILPADFHHRGADLVETKSVMRSPIGSNRSSPESDDSYAEATQFATSLAAGCGAKGMKPQGQTDAALRPIVRGCLQLAAWL